MIDLRELRIGNFVCYRSDISGQEKEIEVEWTFFAEDFWPKHSHPIPLSPEWLERFGAIWPYEDKLRLQIGSISFYHSPTGLLYVNDSGYNEAISEGIEYVHQLQNLYFSLTGKELELKQ